jgi:hypothetical protein
VSTTCVLIPGSRCDVCEAQLWPDDPVGHIHHEGETIWLCADCWAEVERP